MGKSIAIVVPTCRPELYTKTFLPAWFDLVDKHHAYLLTVRDHEDVSKITLDVISEEGNQTGIPIKKIVGKNLDLIHNRNAGIKNVGFAYIAKHLPEVEYIVALDDDVKPIGDSIQDHLGALNMRVPVSWMAVGDVYTRGFPYSVREEAEVVLSHGVWDGCPDLDAPTQLVRGTTPMSFVRMPIPKGIYYPMCEMNVAFKRKMLPYMYLSPQIRGEIERCDDIFCGIESKRVIDANGWAAVTGYSRVYHERASSVFANLVKEAKFISLNETYWQGNEIDPFFKTYRKKRERWAKWLKK